ncbi:MAG: hypothetical protein J2O48_11300 [Solirubrobacterales bacterium]|nr:hypothetical protein [Solirubrobacterales bacterium]
MVRELGHLHDATAVREKSVEAVGLQVEGFRLGVALAVLALMLTACGVPSSSAGRPTPGATPKPVLVTTGTAAVGGKAEMILVDADGRTLYYHTTDHAGRVSCTAATECADNWPPLKLPSKNSRVVGGTRVAGTLGTVPSPSGGQQVTYEGWPLYRFVNDIKEGDTRGHGWNGQWFVATPNLAPAS